MSRQAEFGVLVTCAEPFPSPAIGSIGGRAIFLVNVHTGRFPFDFAGRNLAAGCHRFDRAVTISTTGHHIRSARKLLGWTVTTLSKRSGQSAMVIATMEETGALPAGTSDNAKRRIVGALEEAGVEFVDDVGPGVRLRF